MSISDHLLVHNYAKHLPRPHSISRQARVQRVRRSRRQRALWSDSFYGSERNWPAVVGLANDPSRRGPTRSNFVRVSHRHKSDRRTLFHGLPGTRSRCRNSFPAAVSQTSPCLAASGQGGRQHTAWLDAAILFRHPTSLQSSTKGVYRTHFSVLMPLTSGVNSSRLLLAPVGSSTVRKESTTGAGQKWEGCPRPCCSVAAPATPWPPYTSSITVATSDGRFKSDRI